MEEIELYLDEAKELMTKAISRAESEFAKIRAGKASPAMLTGLMVDYYGSMTPLDQVASVNSPDARSLLIKPWEKSVLGEIEKSIMNSDLGLNPQNDGETIRINIPALTEERRKDLVKQAKGEGENAKVSVRNIRKDINNQLKKLVKEGASEDQVKSAEDTVQKLTDTYSKTIDELLVKKEADIMTI
ncbi:MAG: ribosome recycling factor [Cyclobacteriaceae bacterium]